MLWYIYTMEYYSVIKRNKIESVVAMWMNLEFVIQREVHQKERNKYHILTHTYIKSRNMVLMSLFVGQQERSRHTEQTCRHGQGSRERDKLRE